MTTIRILCRHPINSPHGPDLWDGKQHEYDGNLLDVRALGAWLTKRTGISFNYLPGHSRREGDRCVFFPTRRQVGVHCMWVEKAAPPLADPRIVEDNTGSWLTTPTTGRLAQVVLRAMRRSGWVSAPGHPNVSFAPVNRGTDMPATDLYELYQVATMEGT